MEKIVNSRIPMPYGVKTSREHLLALLALSSAMLSAASMLSYVMGLESGVVVAGFFALISTSAVFSMLLARASTVVPRIGRRILALVLCGYGVGLGLRLSLPKLLSPGSTIIYIIDLFNAVFDWLGLALLSCANIALELREIWKEASRRSELETELESPPRGIWRARI